MHETYYSLTHIAGPRMKSECYGRFEARFHALYTSEALGVID